MRVQFVIPGQPRGKGRPRMTRSGHCYTPKETVQHENLVRLCAAGELGGAMLKGAVRCNINVYISRPKSHYGTGRNADKRKDSAPYYPAGKPDCDNIAKAICDAMNGLAYHDDAQVVRLSVNKHYVSRHEQSYTEVEVAEI